MEKWTGNTAGLEPVDLQFLLEDGQEGQTKEKG